MKSKGSRANRSERRRKLAEVNLLSEPRTRVVAPRRGCVLPFFGGGLALLAATALLHGLGS